MFRTVLLTIAVSLTACLPAAQAATIPLYDASAGGTPSTQSWLLYGSDGFFSGGSANQTAQTGGTQLSTDTAVSAGYSNYNPITLTPFNPAFPDLDAAAGFSLSFDLRVDSEGHANANRAGFSVLLLDRDSVGIELGFWEGEIWAQNLGFSHGEGVAFDTTAGLASFELRIVDSVYTLLVDGLQVLGGALRDYASPSVPYELGSYVFLGDDTGSAAASVLLGDITLTTSILPAASVPAPAVAALLLPGLILLRRRCIKR